MSDVKIVCGFMAFCCASVFLGVAFEINEKSKCRVAAIEKGMSASDIQAVCK